MKLFYLKSYDEREEWVLEERETMYIYSYLFLFSQKYDLLLFENEVLLRGELLQHLSQYIAKSLEVLLNDLYRKPDENSIRKHPTRYERFIFNNEKYTVNYTTSISGRLMYLLYLRIDFIRNKIENNESIFLTFK